MKEKSCQEKLYEEYKDRRDDLKEIWSVYTCDTEQWLSIDKSLLELIKTAYAAGLEDGENVSETSDIQNLADAYLEKRGKNLCWEPITALLHGYIDGLLDSDGCRDNATRELCNYGLCFEYRYDEENGAGYFQWLFSTGGPEDLVRFYCGPNFTLHSVEYRYHDRFDGAGKTIDRYHKDFPFWKELWNWFEECGTPQHLYEQAREER